MFLLLSHERFEQGTEAKFWINYRNFIQYQEVYYARLVFCRC